MKPAIRPVLLSWIGALSLLSACSPPTLENPAPAAAQQITVVVEPSSATVAPEAAMSFTAAVYGTADDAIAWTIAEPGGGTIDAQGRYVAPQTAGTYHAVATSAADASASATATITVAP